MVFNLHTHLILPRVAAFGLTYEDDAVAVCVADVDVCWLYGLAVLQPGDLRPGFALQTSHGVCYSAQGCSDEGLIGTLLYHKWHNKVDCFSNSASVCHLQVSGDADLGRFWGGDRPQGVWLRVYSRSLCSQYQCLILCFSPKPSAFKLQQKSSGSNLITVRKIISKAVFRAHRQPLWPGWSAEGCVERWLRQRWGLWLELRFYTLDWAQWWCTWSSLSAPCWILPSHQLKGTNSPIEKQFVYSIHWIFLFCVCGLWQTCRNNLRPLHTAYTLIVQADWMCVWNGSHEILVTI